jgi:branched-chain amino acid transport system ATP-binding protein
MTNLLEVEGLNSYYDDSHILFDVSLHVARHEVVALLGRNGAGKSTTLKSLIGAVRPRSGRITLDGIPTHVLPPHAIATLGLQLVPEERRIFGSLNVEENLVLAGLTAKGRWPLDRIYAMFPRLRERRRSRGTDLSGGEQQMLAIARALIRRSFCWTNRSRASPRSSSAICSPPAASSSRPARRSSWWNRTSPPP